jgi:hypothetical protein
LHGEKLVEEKNHRKSHTGHSISTSYRNKTKKRKAAAGTPAISEAFKRQLERGKYSYL